MGARLTRGNPETGACRRGGGDRGRSRRSCFRRRCRTTHDRTKLPKEPPGELPRGRIDEWPAELRQTAGV